MPPDKTLTCECGETLALIAYDTGAELFWCPECGRLAMVTEEIEWRVPCRAV